MASKVTDILRTISIFQGLSEADLAKIAKLVKEKKLGDDQLLFRQGDKGDALYVVLQGRVKIWTTDQFGREKVFAFNGEGDLFGEMALLTGAPRSANATTTIPSRVLQLRKDDFDVLLASNVDVMKAMLRVAAERQSATSQRVTQEATADTGTSRGQLTVVFSPRGGSGKTTLAVNLAVALAQTTPDRVVLIDLDLLFGHTPVMLNLTPRTSLAALSPASLRTMDRDGLSYYLSVHEDSSLRVLNGALRAEDGELVTGDHVRSALDLLLKQFVHVVVDTNRSFSDANLAALEAADQVLLLCTADLACLRDMRECQRIFFDLLGFDRERFRYVLNRTLPYSSVPTDQVERALESKLAAEIPYGGDVPSLDALEGHALVMRHPANAASRAIAELATVSNRTAQEALSLRSR